MPGFQLPSIAIVPNTVSQTPIRKACSRSKFQTSISLPAGGSLLCEIFILSSDILEILPLIAKHLVLVPSSGVRVAVDVLLSLIYLIVWGVFLVVTEQVTDISVVSKF